MKNYYENSKNLSEEKLIKIMNSEFRNYASKQLGFPIKLVKSYGDTGDFKIGNTPFIVTLSIFTWRELDITLSETFDYFDDEDIKSNKAFIDIFTRSWINEIENMPEVYFCDVNLSIDESGNCTVDEFKRILKAFDYEEYYDEEEQDYNKKDFIKYCLYHDFITNVDESFLDEFL